MNIFGFGGKPKQLDIDVAMIISWRGEELMTPEQWMKIIDRLLICGVKSMVFIPEELDENTLRIIKRLHNASIGLIIDGDIITPRVAMILAKTKVDWIKIVMRGGSKKEIEGVKTAVSACLNVKGVIPLFIPDGLMLKDIEYIGVPITDYGDFGMIISADGCALCKGKEIGNILTDGWDDIFCAVENVQL